MASGKPMPRGRKLFLMLLFPIPFLGIGVGLLYEGIGDIARARASWRWPTAPGLIERSSVETRSNSYYVGVGYSFYIGDERCTGTLVFFGSEWGSGSRRPAEKVINRYPQGKEVTVYYLAEDPSVCVLEPGIRAITLLLPFSGLIFFLFGAGAAVRIPVMSRKQRNR